MLVLLFYCFIVLLFHLIYCKYKKNIQYFELTANPDISIQLNKSEIL